MGIISALKWTVQQCGLSEIDTINRIVLAAMALQELVQWRGLFILQDVLVGQSSSHPIFRLHFLNRLLICLLTVNISMIRTEVLFIAFKVHRIILVTALVMIQYVERFMAGKIRMVRNTRLAFIIKLISSRD